MDDESHRLGGGVVRELVERGGQARVRLLVAAEELLERRALRRSSCNRSSCSSSVVSGKAVEHSVTALLEAADGRLRLGERHQERDPVLSRRSFGEEAERELEPAGRAGRRSPGGRLPGFAQHGDGAQIAVPGGVLDVVGAHGGRCALRRERVGAVLVGGKPHPGRAGLVHRVPDQRMAEAEPARAPPPIAPGRGRPSSSIASRASGSSRPAAARARSSSKGSPATAPGLGQAPCRHREPVELANDGCDDRAGHVTVVLGGAQAAVLATPATRSSSM